MAIDIVDLALGFIESYGLIAIFVLLVLDGALLLPVFPGELVLIMAVATYATDPAGLIFLILLTTLAGLLGSLLLYAITRGGGRRLVERFPKFFMMPRKRRERLERVFQRPIGQSLVLFLRLFPLTRVLVSIPAGLAKMPLVRFVVLSTLGLTAYHTGFLWFAYEVRRPGSTLGTQTAELQEAYANPAWAFVQANAIITGIVAIGIALVLSVRASRRTWHDPEESAGTLVGTIATAILFWGGLALAAATYLDPDAVYALIEVGGVDIQSVAERLGYGPVQVLFAVAALSMLIGYLVARYRRTAEERRKTRLAVEQAIAEREAKKRVAFKPAAAPLEPRKLSPWPDEQAGAAGATQPAQDADGTERPPEEDVVLDELDDTEWDWRDP